jgi:hypothetical protein
VGEFSATSDPTSGEDDIHRELALKIKSGTIIQIITDTTTAYGALAETGLLAFNALVTGQRYILYLDPKQSDKSSLRATYRSDK